MGCSPSRCGCLYRRDDVTGHAAIMGPRCNLHAHVGTAQAIDLDARTRFLESLRAGLGRIHIHRSQVQPHTDCGEVDEGEEVVCPPVISSGEPAEVLELVEAALDAVAQLVDRLVVWNGDLARTG